MDKKEKQLLDYMYEQAQNLIDYMHRNGMQEYHAMASAMPWHGDDPDRFDMIYCDIFKYEDCGRIMLEKKTDVTNNCTEYRDVMLEGEKCGV